MPTQVEIVSFSGDALNWVKAGVVVVVALGLVAVLLLTVLVVRGLWR